MRTLSNGPGDITERDAVEIGEIVETTDVGPLVRYARGGDIRWALIDDTGRVVVGTEQEVRTLA